MVKCMLTSKQRAYLRSLAAPMDTIYQVGKGGITAVMCEQIAAALEARELIKLRVLDNCDYSSREAAEKIAEATDSEVVQVIGTRFVLFRKSQKKPKIELPRP